MTAPTLRAQEVVQFADAELETCLKENGRLVKDLLLYACLRNLSESAMRRVT